MKGWLAGVPSSEERLAGHRALNANVDGRVLSAAVLNKVNLSNDNGVMKRRDDACELMMSSAGGRQTTHCETNAHRACRTVMSTRVSEMHTSVKT